MNAGVRLIDFYRKTDILGKYDMLKESYARDHSNDIADNLANLLLTLKKHNAWYKPLLKQFSDAYIIGNPYDVLNNLPVSDKHSINKNYNLIFSPIKDRQTQAKKTGGSTGQPFHYIVDKEHLSWFWAHIYFFWNQYSGYEPGDPFITIAGNSLRTSGKRVLENVYHYLQNNYFIKGDIINTSVSINTKHAAKAVLLYGYPSSIVNMLAYKPDFPKYTKNIKAIFTTSEQLLPAVREKIESAFGVPVFDMYGANDGGILSCECTSHDGYHFNAANCYVETFTNEFGMSELLLTNLTGYSFPFVRYRVGDLGSIDYSPCKCGLMTPRIISLKGRTRDLLAMPDGSKMHGSWFNNLFYSYKDIDGYRIVQQKNLHITIYLHVKGSKYEEVKLAVSKDIKHHFPAMHFGIEELKEFNPTNNKFKLIESHAS